jgi:hypothetical protein
MSKHTPGPWFIHEDQHDNVTIKAPDGDGVPWNVATILSYCGDPPCDKANARLIAAAPELLEALQELYNADWSNLCGRAQEVCERAIAKANGKEETE